MVDSPWAVVQEVGQLGPWVVVQEVAPLVGLRNSLAHLEAEAEEALLALRAEAPALVELIDHRFDHPPRWKGETHQCRSCRQDSHAPAS